jgi:hypothetical protein
LKLRYNAELTGPRQAFRSNWSIQLDLEAVGDGGLQILTTFGECETKVTNKGIEGLSKYEGYVKTCTDATKTRLSALQKSLAEDLEKQRGLVLPASGVFYFKNPILGHNGDLICSLSYNDTASNKFFDESPRVNAEAKPRADITLQNGQELPKAVAPLVFKIAEA